ncbi:hypothetical protein HRR78_000730 [Exophiala dermatitidis]|nr:hypothetical protein HRR75_001636 [Exophiala dermatitidis]KAJ4560203.1 hypothetical protein HRR78_000730 [Exophiala dermatitidis]
MAGSKSQTGAPANAVPAGPGHEQEPKEIKAATPPYSDFPKRHGRSLSHWLAIVQGDPLLAHRTTDDLPSSADIVVIGSGMTGTLVTKACLETWPNKRVVVLEANDFCSGATGRNAGHCKPDQWRGFAEYQKQFGTQQALKILQNEQQTWSNLVKYVRENNVDCDLWVGDTLDVPMTPEIAKAAKQDFESYKAAGGKVDHIKVTQDPAEATKHIKISRVKEAQACYAWPASTLHPWKLAAYVMRENIKKGANLQTHTVARRVRQSPRSSGKWIVETDRGEIECSQVVHATNAYSAALEPSLSGLIRPIPHICTKVVPPETFSGSKRLQNSYGVLLPNRALITINPRTTSDGHVLFGGSNPGQPRFEKWLEEHGSLYTDDGLTGFKPITEAVRSFAQSQLVDWADEFKNPEGAINQRSWSGIIGLSADGVPFVGQLPGLPGQWVCAGHHGHGMARIFTAAPGLVQLMAGKPWASTELPDVYQITPARVQQLKRLMSSGSRLSKL